MAFRASEVVSCLGLAIFAGAFSGGCTESVESTDVRTSGIYPEITVTANGNGNSRVVVELKVGGSDSNTFLDLKGSDKLEVTVGETTKALEGSGRTYSATFSGHEEGMAFTIAFLRGADDDSAPESKVSLPAPFTVAIEGTELSRETDDLIFNWDPKASGDIAWELDGDCVKPESDDTPDDGAHTIDADIIDHFESDKDESCTATLTLTRELHGEIDPAFTEGGRIVARQVRDDTFTSTP